MACREELVRSASRWATAPGVAASWHESFRDVPETEEKPSRPRKGDPLRIGWRYEYSQGITQEELDALVAIALALSDEPLSFMPRPHPESVLMWRDLDGDLTGWTVSVGFVLEDGAPLVRLVVFYNEDGPARVAEAQRELRITEAQRGLQKIADAMPETFARWTSLVEGRPGRRGTALARRAVWAKRRVLAEDQAKAAGQPVIAWMAEKYRYSPGSVTQYVHKARAEGLLSPRDVKPPQLTAKALHLLEEEEQLRPEVVVSREEQMERVRLAAHRARLLGEKGDD